jgi:hypothetical protein
VNVRNNFEKFKEEILKRLKSTVKTILVISCKDGLSFLKQLYSGLNHFNCICNIVIYCNGEDLKKDMVEDEVKKTANLPENI